MGDSREEAARIMVVDDEFYIRDLLQFLLNDEGYDVLTVGTGEEALNIVRRSDIQLVILDINLPGIDGFAVCRELRNMGLPVLFLSSRDDDYDVIFGLEVGALDYLRKPFNHRELILRVANLVGRKPESNLGSKVYSSKDISVDTASGLVSIDGKNVRLTPNEFDLLVLLMSRRGAVLTPEEILRNIWGTENREGGRELVKVNITRLRKKIEPEPHHPEFIVNQWGRGYRFQGTVSIS